MDDNSSFADRMAAQDASYEAEYSAFIAGLSPEERKQYEALGLCEPELPTFTVSAKRPEIHENIAIEEASSDESRSPARELLEWIWQQQPERELAMVRCLAWLGDPFYTEFDIPQPQMGAISEIITRATEHDRENVLKYLLLILQTCEGDEQPLASLIVFLKWFQSPGFISVSDEDIGKIFGFASPKQTFSQVRWRMKRQLGTFIPAGKSKENIKGYEFSNQPKRKNGFSIA